MRIDMDALNKAKDSHYEDWIETFTPEVVKHLCNVADACLNGYAQGQMNDGKYLPPDVRKALQPFQKEGHKP